MKKSDIVKIILEGKSKAPRVKFGKSFAPSNIALCKYWGKRNAELNLPVTSSLSISLGSKGTTTTVSIASGDEFFLNNKKLEQNSNFSKRISEFLDLFRMDAHLNFRVETESNIPTAAGLASSASGFASLTRALNQLLGWQLEEKELSILARLGSGSACRSIWQGFVAWESGIREDGMDSHGVPISVNWPELCIGLLVLNQKEKEISSREAMLRTQQTSPLYEKWPEKVSVDLPLIERAIQEKNFKLLGSTAESNAIYLHRMMNAAKPAISYFLPETIQAIQRIGLLRQQGLSIYFTQDAGPNLKLLFLKNEAESVLSHFPGVEVISNSFMP